MTDPVTPSPGSPTSSNHVPSESALVRLARMVLYLSIAAAVVILTYAGYQVMQARTLWRKTENALTSQIGVSAARPKRLAPHYTDKEGRLLADPPADPSKLLNPKKIAVAFAEDSDLDVQPIDWDEFQTHLAEATGKVIELQPYENTGDDVAEIRDGKVHVAALHAADAPYLVNTAGFIPVAVVGSAAGAEGNHLDLAVSKKSNVRKLADLRGRTLTCTMPASITGHRAAVAVLLQKVGLRPGIDYVVSFSGGQKRSAMGLAASEFEVAALSHDKVKSLLATGEISEAVFQTIYQSEVIPRFTIGYVFNLEPDLAATITDAILSFENEGGPIDDDHSRMRFFPTNYKQDFAFVRKIDESFDPRLKPNRPKPDENSELAAGSPQS